MTGAAWSNGSGPYRDREERRCHAASLVGAATGSRSLLNRPQSQVPHHVLLGLELRPLPSTRITRFHRIQEKVAFGVAGVIEPSLQVAEIRRWPIGRPNDLTTYDLYLRALAHSLSFEKDQVAQALDLLGALSR
jgi:hypothetical protein